MDKKGILSYTRKYIFFDALDKKFLPLRPNIINMDVYELTGTI
jgi:hypothetical protein